MAEQNSDPEKKYVSVDEAEQHGYIGYSPGAEKGEDLTLAAQTDTGQTAKTTDTPKSVDTPKSTSRTSSK